MQRRCASRGIHHCQTGYRRRGATAVTVAISSVVMLGSAALTIDLGQLYLARGELQRAADAAAMAGASAYLSDAHWHTAVNGAWTLSDDLALVIDARAQEYSLANPTLGKPTILSRPDIIKGSFDYDEPSAALDTSGSQRFNAVQVTVRRTAGSDNGPVEYFFAHILGHRTGSVIARATAAVDDHFSGYTQDEDRVLIPFTIQKSLYDELVASGPDQFSYDSDAEAVHAAPDSVREVRLFPWKTSSKGSAGSGTYGALNIGTPNQGLPALIDQIEYGVQPANLTSEIGSPDVTFVGADGGSVTYEMTGETGLGAGMASALAGRIGDVVGFFLHDAVKKNGSKSVFTIVGVRFGRVMQVDLQGSPNSKRLVIQPVAYTGPGVHTDPNAPPSDGQVGLITLVR